jgi:hypothetical protein
MELAQLTFTTAENMRGWSAPLPRYLDSDATMVLAFGHTDLAGAESPLGELARAFPRSILLGCSSAGDVAGGRIVDGGLSVVVARFDRSQLTATTTEVGGVDDSFDAGRRLADAIPTDGLRAVFVLSKGVAVNGAALVDGITSLLPTDVPISGGLAGDGDRFERTWVAGTTGASERTVAAVGFYGESLRIGHGCESGWQAFGPERVVTHADGNVLYELDGKPALSLYTEYLGDLAAQLPGSALLFPLSIRPADGGPTVVRTILGIDEAAQSMTFAGEMPVGSVARLMRTNIDRLAISAENAARDALGDIAVDTALETLAEPVLALSVSCVGRRLVMGERAEEELEAVMLGLPEGSVVAGFYSYGEISPQLGFCAGALHNQTMTVTMIAESV